MQIQAHSGGVMIDGRRIHLQRDDVARPFLRANVSHLGTGPGYEVVDATGEARCGPVTRAEMFDDRDLRELISDQKQVREDGHVVMSQPMEDLDGLFDLYAARHEEKCSRRNERLMQRGEFGRTERR